jgi:hypothetical protein
MFDDLENQIDATTGRTATRAEQAVRFVLVAVVSMLLFGGLLVAVWVLEY